MIPNERLQAHASLDLRPSFRLMPRWTRLLIVCYDFPCSLAKEVPVTPEFIAIIAVGATIFGSNVAMWLSLWLTLNGLSGRVGKIEGLLEARAS